MNEHLSQLIERFNIENLMVEHPAPTLKTFTASTAFYSCYLMKPNFYVFQNSSQLRVIQY